MTDPPRFRRGAIWRVRLDPVEGSEQGGTRPALVITNDVLNDALPIVMVAPITSRKVERVFKTEVLIEPPEGSLALRSKVVLYQARAVSKSRCIEELGMLSDARMASVEIALRRTLDL